MVKRKNYEIGIFLSIGTSKIQIIMQFIFELIFIYQDATFFVKGDKNLDSVIKDLGKLDINVLPKFIIYVVIFMSLVLLVSLIISSFNILRKNPKKLLIDNN